MDHKRAEELMAARFTEAALPMLEERALRAHLKRCEPCRELYDRYARVEAALQGNARAPSEAQLARMLAMGPRLPERRRPLRYAVPLVAALAAVAVVALLSLRPNEPTRPTDEAFTARGGEAHQGAWIQAFTKRGGETTPATEGVHVGDGLLFAYSTERAAPYRYLAILARDDQRVHWFHPAYERPEDDPQSVAIERGVADEPLPEVVYVPLRPGPLEICGLFTAEPLNVRAVDAALEGEGRWPEAHRRCVTVEVRP